MSEMSHPDTPENIDWQSFLPAVMPLLREKATRVLGSGYEPDAEDIVMDVVFRFLSYKSHLPDFQSEDSARRYLVRMVHNMAVEYRSSLKKKDRSLDPLDLIEDKQAQPSIERMVYDDELREILRKELGPLSDRERRLLNLHLSGYSSKEIAEDLREDIRLTRADLNAVLVKVRYRLAKAKSRSGGRPRPRE